MGIVIVSTAPLPCCCIHLPRGIIQMYTDSNYVTEITLTLLLYLGQTLSPYVKVLNRMKVSVKKKYAFVGVQFNSCLKHRASFAWGPHQNIFTSRSERSMRVPPWRQASQSAEGGTEELPTLESNQETAAEKVSHRPGVTAPHLYQH